MPDARPPDTPAPEAQEPDTVPGLRAPDDIHMEGEDD